MRGKPVEGVAAEVALRHPGYRLNVAQSARAGLHVGLEVVGRVVRFEMALGLLANLGLEEFFHRPDTFR